jgi:pimeloyl-ACP methyl ester carboxylesterase
MLSWCRGSAVIKNASARSLIVAAKTLSNSMRKLNASLPGSRYVELAGAGHISNLDQPAAFNRAVADFLGGA